MTDRARSASSSEGALASAIAIVARGRTPEEDLAALLDGAIQAVGAERGAVFLWDAERGRLAIASSLGFAEGEATALEGLVAGDPDHPIARTAHGQTQIAGAAATAPVGEAGTGASWPLRVAHDGVEEPLGALAVSRSGPWNVGGAAAELLAAWADLIAITVDRTRLTAAASERVEWTERMSHTDALTGLANARTLSRVLELEVARAGRQGTDLSIALFDVDGLARTNAASGTAAGDDVLREVAAVLAESIRLVDTVARWGGDEFLVVAPGPAGLTVAHRVLDAVAAHPSIGGRSISVSAGVARFPSDGVTSEELIEAARAALGTAKGSGPGSVATVSG